MILSPAYMEAIAPFIVQRRQISSNAKPMPR